MKCKLNLLLGFIFLYVSNLAHAQITFPKNVDPKDVVAKLFDSRFNPADSTFRWIPNKRERLEFYMDEENDTLVTKLDTVFDYNQFGTKNKLVLVSTRPPQFDCHGCQPTLGLIEMYFDEETNEYKLSYINKDVTKYGIWGSPAYKRNLVMIAEGEMALIVTETSLYSGVEMSFSSIYKNGEKIFSFISSFSDEGAKEFEYQRTRYRQYMSFDKKRNLLKITKKGKEPNLRGKIVPVLSVSFYTYEDGFLNKKSTLNLLHKK